MVDDDNKSKQNNINTTFPIFIGLFQEQSNKLNSENLLEFLKAKLNTNTEV